MPPELKYFGNLSVIFALEIVPAVSWGWMVGRHRLGRARPALCESGLNSATFGKGAGNFAHLPVPCIIICQ